MFSTFRSTVEALAQATDRPKTPDQLGSPARKSTDLFASSSVLAESALTNLKKTLVNSHPSPQTPPRPGSAQSNVRRTPGMSLEDRLRATFTVGEVSRATTPGTPASAVGTSNQEDSDTISAELPLSGSNQDAMQIASPSLDQHVPSTSTPPISTAFESHTASSDDSPLAASFVSVRSLVNSDDHPLSPGPPASPPPKPYRLEPSTLAVGSHPHLVPEETVTHSQGDLADTVVPQEERDASARPETASEAAAEVLDDIDAPPHIDVVSSDDIDSVDVGEVPSVEVPAQSNESEVDVEKLQSRLKLVEQRFTDVSTSFKRLQVEKRTADALLKELTPLESISDIDGLRDYLRNFSQKLELSMEEIKRLSAQLRTQEARMDELRDTHRLESASQIELVDQLRAQLEDSNTKLAIANSAAASTTSSQQATVAQLTTELEKARNVAKEQDEMRTKAINLLKTVRTKQRQTEKEKEDKEKEVAQEKAERERLSAELKRLETDIERGRSEREREISALREQFEKELSSVRERFEREAAARKGQFELDAITTKATHNQEIAAKVSQITSLETSVRSLSAEKASLFDQLQQRQGEVESAQSHLETLQSQTGELQYQLREVNDRVALLQDELASQPISSTSGGAPSEDVARFLREAEGKYEARLGDLRERMRALEKERNESEEEWSRNLNERSREVERLRRLVGEKDGEYDESVRGMREREKKISELEAVNASLMQELVDVRTEMSRLQDAVNAGQELEAALRRESTELQLRADFMAEQADEFRSKESQLRTTNKTLRDELRKVQQSAALLERQRNPGVGYWSGKGSNGSATNGDASVARRASESSEVLSPPGSPRPSSPAISQRSEEDVNLEYLRNVILQFLEHKEMRPNLVRVLSTILRFTPQETRRLIAKV